MSEAHNAFHSHALEDCGAVLKDVCTLEQVEKSTSTTGAKCSLEDGTHAIAKVKQLAITRSTLAKQHEPR